MLQLFWSSELREAHKIALAEAQEVYDRYKDEDTVISRGSGPGYSYVSAASPEREAWDVYFGSMREQGHSAWDTKKVFDRQLKTK